MRKYLMPFIVVSLILFRLTTSSFIGGKHSSPMQTLIYLYEISNSFNHVMIGMLLLIILKSFDFNAHNKWFLSCGITFCFLLSIIELYVLLPTYISCNIKFISNPFFNTFGFLSICLVLYYFICIKNKLLA